MVVNALKNFVARSESAMSKASRCLMHWAKAITTCFGKSVTAAISSPEVIWSEQVLKNRGIEMLPDLKLSDAFEDVVLRV